MTDRPAMTTITLSSRLEELAAKCEWATGSDRELDVAIVYALYPDIGHYEGQCIGDDPIFWHEPYRKQPCPFFTTSLDAATTLVPEGWQWAIDSYGRASCFRPDAPKPWPCAGGLNATRPALALCAAALRAHAKLKGEGNE
jgi:hypothetical protein